MRDLHRRLEASIARRRARFYDRNVNRPLVIRSPGQRYACWLGILICGWVAAWAWAMLIVDRLPGALIFAVPLTAAALWLAVVSRSAVRADPTSSHLVVRNPFRAIEVPWTAVRSFTIEGRRRLRFGPVRESVWLTTVDSSSLRLVGLGSYQPFNRYTSRGDTSQARLRFLQESVDELTRRLEQHRQRIATNSESKAS